MVVAGVVLSAPFGASAQGTGLRVAAAAEVAAVRAPTAEDEAYQEAAATAFAYLRSHRVPATGLVRATQVGRTSRSGISAACWARSMQPESSGCSRPGSGASTQASTPNRCR